MPDEAASTAELAKRIASLACLQFTVAEIADATGAKVKNLRDPRTPHGAAVKRGRFDAEVAIRTALLKGARDADAKALDRFAALTRHREDSEGS